MLLGPAQLSLGLDVIQHLLQALEGLAVAGEVGLELVAAVEGFDLGEAPFEGVEVGAGVVDVLFRR